METLINANIFFFISTIGFIIISAIFIVILWNVAIIMNDARRISRKIREGSEALSDDLNDFRANMHTEGAEVKHIWKYFKNLFKNRPNHKK
jgi:hypothetical protein